METLAIERSLWAKFVAVASRKRKRPEVLAAQLLREYLQKVADEELLAKSEKAARRAKFRIHQAEEIVRQYRYKKHSKKR